MKRKKGHISNLNRTNATIALSFKTNKMNVKKQTKCEKKENGKRKAKRMRMLRIGMEKFKILNYLFDKRYRSA